MDYCNSKHPKKEIFCIRKKDHEGLCSDEEKHRGI